MHRVATFDLHELRFTTLLVASPHQRLGHSLFQNVASVKLAVTRGLVA